MNTCELKKLYIPQCVKGDVSISQAARLIGCTRQTVINLKKKFRDIGEKAFIHGSKGRIERLWETLQKRLPYIFRYYGIKTIEKANVFLESYIDIFNGRFSVAPQSSAVSWKKKPRNINEDYLFSIREPKKLKYDGSFIFHDTKFKCPVLRNKNAEICISEDFGVKCFYSGKFYDVVLDDTIADLHGGKLSQVEQDLFARFFLSDKHSSFAKIG